MTPRKRGPFPLAVLALLVLSACQTVAPEDPGVAISPGDARVRAVLERYQAQSLPRSALRARARLSLEGAGFVLSRPQRLVVQRPASLRIEVLALFEQVAALVVTDGLQYSFVDLTSGVQDSGPVDDGLLWRTARVDLTPADAVALALGAPLLGSEAVAARQFSDGRLGVESAEPVQSDDAGDTGAPHSRWHEWDRLGRLHAAELRDGTGTRVWRAEYGDWQDVDGVSFAHRVDLEFTRVEAEASIRFQRVELEPELAPGLFVLHVPPGG